MMSSSPLHVILLFSSILLNNTMKGGRKGIISSKVALVLNYLVWAKLKTDAADPVDKKNLVTIKPE